MANKVVGFPARSSFVSAQKLSHQTPERALCFPNSILANLSTGQAMSQKSASDYNLHHFSWFEAPIPCGFICLARAFIFAARRLHSRIWTAHRGIGTLAPQASPEQDDEVGQWKPIFDALIQLCAPPICTTPVSAPLL